MFYKSSELSKSFAFLYFLVRFYLCVLSHYLFFENTRITNLDVFYKIIRISNIANQSNIIYR